MNKLQNGISKGRASRGETDKERIQFHPAGAPVPLSARTREVLNNMGQLKRHTSHGKNVLGAPEPVRPAHTNGKPDNAEEEVKHHQPSGEFEDEGVEPGRKIVDRNRDD